MKTHIFVLIIFTSWFSCSIDVSNNAYASDNTREPVYAGRFYPADPEILKAKINELTRKALKTRLDLPDNMKLKALVMPHAGYIYSGWTAAHVSSFLKKKDFKKIVLLGPDHRVGFKENSVSKARAWKTPLGEIQIDKDASKLLRDSSLFSFIPASDKTEHSLEVILPFLQTYLDSFSLVPVTVGFSRIKETAQKIASIIDEQTLVVISSDLSHYLDYDTAVATDKKTIEMVLNFNEKDLLTKENAACGKKPLLILIQLAKKMGWKPYLLHYSNSGDTAGPKSQVVGYCSIAFFEGAIEKQKTNLNVISAEQGDILVKLARQTIAKQLGKKVSKEDFSILEKELEQKAFEEKKGTFVTLHINERLRGCIGSLQARESLRESVKNNSINAAFHDPRFARLSLEEFHKTDIEVSILSNPQKLDYKDAKDLIAKLKPGLHGVIIQKGWARATFLPQVWDQLPQVEQFLSYLCSKAGLAKDEWQKGELEVLTYYVQYFKEKH